MIRLATLSLSLMSISTVAFAQSDLSKLCPVKSPQMQLVKTCSQGELSRVAHHGIKFIDSADSDSGANYCYNSLVAVESKPGFPLKVRVLRDTKDGQLRSYAYSVAEKAIAKGSTGNLLLPLGKLEGKCYFTNPQSEDHCSGFLGLGSNDIPMVLELKQKPGAFDIGVTKDRSEIKSVKSRALRASLDHDRDEVNRFLVEEMRSRLLAHAKEMYSQVTEKKKTSSEVAKESPNYLACVKVLEEFTTSQKVSPALYPKSDARVLDEVARFFPPGAKPAMNGGGNSGKSKGSEAGR